MITIAVLNQKGGVGKSTVATNLAAAAHLDGKRTLIVDLDEDGSAFEWYAARSDDSALAGLTVVKADRPLAPARFREISSSYDVVILDGPPSKGALPRSAAIAADLVLVPVQPGAFDMWKTSGLLEFIADANEARAERGRDAVRVVFVVNRADAKTVVGRRAQSVLREVAVTDVVLHQRIAYVEAAAGGESVLTTEPKGAAAHEIRRLYREVMGNEDEAGDRVQPPKRHEASGEARNGV